MFARATLRHDDVAATRQPRRRAPAAGPIRYTAASDSGSVQRTMKTQLMQDIQESASAFAPPLRRAACPHPVQGGVLATGSPGPARARARAGDPSPAPPPQAQPSSPSQALAAADLPPHADPALPGWLVERLREDGEQAGRQARRSRLQRRMLTWSLGTVALAALAAAGLWLYEENRVDGALGIVANTTPAVTIAAPVVMAPAAPRIDPPADSPIETHSTEPAAIAAAPGADTGARTAAPSAAHAAPGLEAPPDRPPAHTRRVAARSRPPAPASEAGSTRRREETLMQCRAHGYDDRQCDRRACTMTRFGFAGRG